MRQWLLLNNTGHRNFTISRVDGADRHSIQFVVLVTSSDQHTSKIASNWLVSLEFYL